MRPSLRLLDDDLIDRILDEARSLLATLGVDVHDDTAKLLLLEAGARRDAGGRVRIPASLVDAALRSAPRELRLYDSLGRQTHALSGDNVYFTPGSAAIHVLDGETGRIRPPATADYVRYAKLVAGLPQLAAQSTALVPADVPAALGDSWRLCLSLLLGEKPVVTGAFSAAGFALMLDLQLVVRGGARQLRERPLCVFSCCPTAPLAWGHEAGRNLVDCARAGVPVEIVSMPLAGLVAPATLVGTIVQHAAETLSGVVLAQLAAPGAPVVWGGSSAIFDVRHSTTPMGAIESMMLECATSEVGHRLGLPTQGYIALSDAKALDAQAGLETGMGAVLAALSGINSVSGPGLLDFESCHSPEKLVLDAEICGMVARLRRGIEPRDDFPALPLFQELLSERHLLIADHTQRHLKEQVRQASPLIERAPLGRWRERGETTLGARARLEVERLIGAWTPSGLPDETKRALVERMTAAAAAAGLDALPPIET